MDPILLLALVTFGLVLAFLVWNRASAGRHRFGQKKPGIGGVNDPMAGATDEMRDPDVMRADLDAGLKDTRPRST